MKILCVDDEPLALKRVIKMVGELGFDDIEWASNFEDALFELEKGIYDVAILDINLGEKSGIDLAMEALNSCNTSVIFQTAYEEYALKAFDIGVADYILKPYSKERLHKSLHKILHIPKESKFFVKQDGKIFALNSSDIIYIKADLCESILRTKEGFFYINQKISQIEEKLNENFVKIHRSYIINSKKIKYFETVEQSRIRFYFHEIDEYIDSSKDRAREFRKVNNI